MKNITIFVFLMISLLAISVLAAADDQAKSNMKSPDLQKVTFIRYKKGFDKNVKIDFAATTDTTTTTAAACYKLMGVKWPSLPVSYVINPSNNKGLSSRFVTYAISRSAETWDAATAKELFNNVYSVNYSARYGVQDYKNSIVFGSYPSTNIIAVTSVWYSKVTKQIVEFDMLFNSYFNWGNASANRSLMDLQNIATHELGHSIGMSDIYNTCTKETMYGYSDEGDLIKRTLNAGDIAGLRKIYV